MMALEHDMIGIAMTNAVHWWRPLFPLKECWVPIPLRRHSGRKEPPFVADLATTTAANGKLEILQRKK